MLYAILGLVEWMKTQRPFADYVPTQDVQIEELKFEKLTWIVFVSKS